MQEQETDFMACFDPTIAPYVVEFGKRLTRYTEEYDVVLLMARKAVCFAEALRLLRLTSYQCIVTSQRVLDLNLEWLRNKKIAIIDDALITGTTIYQTVQKLKRVGCNVDVYVLCVNTEWWSPQLVQPKDPYLKLNDERTASFCSDIVDAISLIPIPYSTDYPLYTGLRLYPEDFDSLLSTPYWLVNDVTSSLQVKRRVFSKTFEPTASMAAKLNESLGLEIDKHCLIKVRLYGREHSTQKPFFWCNLLPIVAIEPLSKGVVDSLFTSICHHSGCEDKIYCWFDTSGSTIEVSNSRYKAKLHLIQYVLATRLASLWFDSVQAAMSRKLHFQQDSQSVSFLFPYPILNALKSIAYMSGKILSQASFLPASPEKAKIVNGYPYDIVIDAPYRGDDGWNIEMHLTNPFLQLHEKYEIPARLRALEHGPRIFEDQKLSQEHSHYINRLEKGFSLNEIRTWLDHLNGKGLPTQKAISQFLDRMIDRGIVVPTTCISGNFVFRGYRHGEDVKFGEDEKKLIGHTLKAFTKALDREIVSGREVEKLTALLIRQGLASGFLVKPEKNVMGAPNTIGIRYSLHGAVVEEDSTKMWSCESGCSIRDILTSSKYIKEETFSEEQKRKRINMFGSYAYRVVFSGKDRSGIKVNGIDEARIFGHLFGLLRRVGRKYSQKARLTEAELTLLATIPTPRDLAGALAAEVKWGERSFRRQEESLSRPPLHEIETPQLETLAGNFRNAKENTLLVALHSGTWKYRRFFSKEVWKIVTRVGEGLEASEDPNVAILGAFWGKIWNESKDRANTPPPEELKHIISRAAEWLYAMRVYYLMTEIAFLTELARRSPKANLNKAVGRALSELEFCEKQATALHTPERFYADALPEKIASGTLSAEKLRDFSLRAMKRKVIQATDILNTVDAVASNYGVPQPLLIYSSCMLISFACQPTLSKALHDRVVQIIQNSRTEYRKSMGGAEHSIRIVPPEFHEQNNSVMVVAYGHKELEYMVKTLCLVATALAPDADFRILVMHDLPNHAMVYCAKGTNEYFGRMLWNVMNTAVEAYPNFVNRLVTLSGGPSLEEKDLADFAQRQLKTTFGESIVSGKLDVPSNYTSLVTKEYQTILDVQRKTGRSKVDVGIITIVADEARAVEDFLSSYPDVRPDVPGRKSTNDFTLGSLPSKNEQTHSVACILALKQGNQAVMPAYQVLCEEFQPTLVVLLGIGGVIHKDLRIGDVCVANAVLNYDFRAETECGVERTFDPLPPLEPWLLKIYHRLEKKHGEEMKFQVKDSDKTREFRVRIGPIGSGGAVVKDADSEIRAWLERVSRKATLVETEAVGVAQQFQSDKLRHDWATKGYMVVRGASDGADKDKDKLFRYHAAQNAMVFLAEFLRHTQKGFTDDIAT